MYWRMPGLTITLLSRSCMRCEELSATEVAGGCSSARRLELQKIRHRIGRCGSIATGVF
jgi:hypothetical protein